MAQVSLYLYTRLEFSDVKKLFLHSRRMSFLSESFRGKIIEVCIVTPDHKKTMNGLAKLGIALFHIFGFVPSTVPDRNFRGLQRYFELKV